MHKDKVTTLKKFVSIAACLALCTSGALAQAKNDADLECQVSGTYEAAGDVQSVSEIVRVRVREYPLPLISVKGNRLSVVAVGASVTRSDGNSAVGVNRSTEDIWDMASRTTDPAGWRFDTEVRINRVSGTIVLRSKIAAPTGGRGGQSASGNCIAATSGERKF